MAKQELEPQTPLGGRLREVRRRLGDTARPAFAHSLGIPKTTLANYETGLREPTASVLGLYNKKYNIDVHWLLTGRGNMFSNTSIDHVKLSHTIYLIQKTLDKEEKALSPEKMSELIINIYNGDGIDNKENRDNVIHLFKALKSGT